MSSNLERFQNLIFFPLLFILIPLWNIPHTIAARYICEGLLLIAVLIYRPNWKIFFSENKILLIFFAYLLIQLLFFSTNYQQAFSNFRAEWMHCILFSIIGAGVGLALGSRKSEKTLLYLGIAFSIPLYIHLILSIIKGLSIGAIPWRYWGINEHHGDLGYTALMAVIFLFSYFSSPLISISKKTIAIALAFICLLSPLLALSRAGLLFSLGAILLIVLINFWGHRSKHHFRKFHLLAILGIFLTLGLIFKIGTSADPQRWHGIMSRISIGFEGNPINVYCFGISSLENSLKEKGISITPEVQKGLDSVVDGDGARIMAARSGLVMMAKHPFGINQSRQAYQNAITETCGHPPLIFISHTHNAWVDTALAIGIIGSILLFAVMLNYLILGMRNLKLGNEAYPYSIALISTSIIWIFRGISDPTLRDQMLEMQSFSFAMLFGIICMINSRKK